MIKIKLNPVENQELVILLAEQVCKIRIQQLTTGVFLTLTVNDVLVRSMQKCIDRVPVITDAYLGFIGQFVFIDECAMEDPYYTGFGGKFGFYYLEVQDLPA